MKVRYNLKNWETLTGLARNLSYNKIYSVKNVEIHNSTAEYTLEGVEGNYPSSWFEDEKPVYLASGHESHFPTVGGFLIHFKVLKNGNWITEIKSGKILEVIPVSKKIFRVETADAVYILEIS